MECAFQPSVIGLELGALLFGEYDLLEQEVAVIHLAKEVNFELLVALHQLAIVFVDLLRHLGHSFKSFLESLFRLGEVYVVLLEAVVFLKQFLLMAR